MTEQPNPEPAATPENYEQLALPVEVAEPEFDDDGDGGEHSAAGLDEPAESNRPE